MSRNVFAPTAGPAAGAARQSGLGALLTRKAANWRRRRRLNSLVDLDDRILADIGLTRADVVWARRLPLDHNPIRELRRISNQRRTRDFEQMRERAGLLAL